MKLSLIAAYDENRGIGFQGHLPWYLPRDLVFFKQHTLGKPVLMGRKTFESIGRPLPGRKNIVLSKQNSLIEAVDVIHCLEDLQQFDGLEIMVIGGQQIYELTMPYASRIIITQVHASCKVDTYFPEIPQNKFQCISEQHHPADVENQYAMTFQAWKANSDTMLSYNSEF